MNIFEEVKKLNLPLGSYVVFGSGPMVVHGLREPKDIDLLVTPEIYDKLKTEGWEEKEMRSGSSVLSNGVYEVYKDWNFLFMSNYNPDPQEVIKNAEIVNGVPFAQLEEVKRWKQVFGREKDLADIKLIDEFLAKV